MESVLNKLKSLTGKEFVMLTERGNKSIALTLKIAKSVGKKKILLQDQGGWITYKQFADKNKLQIIELKTDSGVLIENELLTKADSDSVLLFNSMPAYSFLEDMKTIYSIAEEKGCLLINDASGSLGTKESKVGDIILGSFGEGKPVNLDYGGFIATGNEDIYNEFKGSFDEKMLPKLEKALDELPERLKMFQKVRKTILTDLEDYDIVHKEVPGINVIIRFSDEKTKKEITDYCDKNNLPYTECPRYIRIKENAISVEVKRL